MPSVPVKRRYVLQGCFFLFRREVRFFFFSTSYQTKNLVRFVTKFAHATFHVTSWMVDVIATTLLDMFFQALGGPMLSRQLSMNIPRLLG